MSKETISEIRRIEEDAKKICEDARAEAKRRVDEATFAAKEMVDAANEQAGAIRRERLEKCHADAEKILAEGKANAQNDMNDILERTELHMKNAIKILLWGISDQCQ